MSGSPFRVAPLSTLITHLLFLLAALQAPMARPRPIFPSVPELNPVMLVLQGWFLVCSLGALD
ncbi:MAG: hypothetical protein R3F61_22540 [Myxococcota bacterium]